MAQKQKNTYQKNEKLRNLRLALNLTQKGLAMKLGLTREVIAAYENKHLPVSKSALLKNKSYSGHKK